MYSPPQCSLLLCSNYRFALLCTYWVWHFLPFLNADFLQFCWIRWRMLVDSNFWASTITVSLHFSAIHLYLASQITCDGNKCSCYSHWDTTIGHDVTTNMPDHRKGVTWVLGCIWFAPNIMLQLQTKWLNISLTKPQYLFPKSLRFSNMAFVRRGQNCEELMIGVEAYRTSPTSTSVLCNSFSVIAGLLDNFLTNALNSQFGPILVVSGLCRIFSAFY